MPKRFYLETSVIRSRLIGHSTIQDSLIEKLKNQTKITSGFVKMEFNRSLICNLIEFYFNLQTQISIDDAIKWWNEDFRPRKIKDVFNIIDKIFIGIDDRKNINHALINLRNEIKKLITSFNCLINRFDQNNTRCYFGGVNLNYHLCKTEDRTEKELVKFHSEYRQNNVSKCRIADFFSESQDKVTAILKYDSKEKGFIKLKEKLSEINIKKIKLSCNSCRKIGDIIIALECPNYAILLSLDKAFEDLGKVLDFKHEIIPSLRHLIPKSKKLH